MLSGLSHAAGLRPPLPSHAAAGFTRQQLGQLLQRDPLALSPDLRRTIRPALQALEATLGGPAEAIAAVGAAVLRSSWGRRCWCCARAVHVQGLGQGCAGVVEGQGTEHGSDAPTRLAARHCRPASSRPCWQPTGSRVLLCEPGRVEERASRQAARPSWRPGGGLGGRGTESV